MIRDERYEKLTEYIHKHRFAGIEELAAVLGVSKATVRRDLALLCSKENGLSMARGGVISDNKDRESELAYEEKKSANCVEKMQIAAAAAELIQPGNVVMLDAGTTVRAMAPFLENIPQLNVVTNDILIAADLSGYENVSVTVTGGQMRKHFYTLRGFVAEDLIGSMRADIAFIGVDAVDLKAGCMITNMDEISLKRSIIAASKRVVVVCDNTKFTSGSFVSICPFSSVDSIITGKKLSRELYEAYRAMKIKVVRV